MSPRMVEPAHAAKAAKKHFQSRKHAARRLANGLPALLAALACLTLFGQTLKAQSRQETATVPALTAADVATLFDALIPLQLQRDSIPGAVIAVVKDGQILFAKGYGFADVAAKRHVSPDATLFRIASISKLFAWTAVMQLVEQGKLNPDRDINEYIDFQIPATYSQAITLRHLMTHTAGFQAVAPDLGLSQLLPLKEYLTEYLPPRIFPPGETPAYSNYGSTLAGYIVQRVSGQSFEDYIGDHIFQPLGMQHSTFIQPLPDSLSPLMAQGYDSATGPPGPFELIPSYPGGGMSTTAEDMAQFMIAHLQEGSLGAARILKPETARLMHSRQFELVPSMNGMCFGFIEEARNGYHIIGHGGSIGQFRSRLYLVPDLQLGFFVVQNGARGDLINTIWRSFFDRYFPSLLTDTEATTDAAADARAVSGFYKVTRRFNNSIFKLYTLLEQNRVIAQADGTISFDMFNENGQPKRLRAISPMMYGSADGRDRIAFRKDAEGNLELIGNEPYNIYQRVPWYEDKRLNIIVIIASAVMFALTLALWPVAALIRWHYGRRLKLSAGGQWVRILVRLVCALNLTFILGGYALFRRLPDHH